MFGKVIETFGTEDCTYVCECPICKTNYVIKPGAKDETGVLITTRNVDTDSVTADGKYVATINKFDICFHITCNKCGGSFTSVVRASNLAHGIEEKKL